MTAPFAQAAPSQRKPPTALVGKDIRRYSVEVTENGAYVGTVMHVFAKNKRQPGGWPNLNTGGFLGPLDLAFDPSGKTAKAFKVWGMPSTYLVGPDGVILMSRAGFDPKKTGDVERLIQEACSK